MYEDYRLLIHDSKCKIVNKNLKWLSLITYFNIKTKHTVGAGKDPKVRL